MTRLRMKTIAAFSFCLSMTLGLSLSLQAGGRLETVDITAGLPSPIPGHIIGRVIGIEWDDRTLPVQYLVNTAAGANVPNPLDAVPVLTLAQATTALGDSLNAWNSIPTSYIDLRIVGNTSNAGLRGFDMINELTFNTAATFTAIASSPSTSLIADSTLVNGDDIDGDGDSDVSNTITRATDADGDGDIEFPAGFYKAGTILDNDVQFNTKVSNGFRFTVGDAALDTVTRSVDLNTVATHEFGHSFGLSHSMDNTTSAVDGDGATMFPFIDTGDPEAERQQRMLHTDDIAWASYLYPEGSTATGPGALQHKDVAFTKVYGLIKGEIAHGTLGGPVAGASVYAIEQKGDRVVASGYSGTTNLSFNPVDGGLFFLPTPADGIVDGAYVIPVPKGSYAVGVEAVDGNPAAAGNISFTCQIGGFYGQMNFNEEFYNRNREGSVEVRPGDDKNVHVNPGEVRSGVDIVTNDSFNLGNFGARNAVGFINSAPGRHYAVQIPAAQISAFLPGQPILAQAALYDTGVVDASVAPVFSEVMLTTGTINPDGTAAIDLDRPLDFRRHFAAQDNDFSPFFLKHPRLLGWFIRRGIERGDIQNLFLVLRIPTTAPFEGVSGQPPLIGLNITPTIFGLSFTSVDDGLTFTPRTDVNFRFSLVLSAVPTPD
jgi:hypothetical protein